MFLLFNADKPQPSIPLVHQEVVVGRTCVLQCLSETANADFELEHPHREWFKENKPIHISPTAPDGDRYYFSNNKELLVILNAQSNDAGHFRCEITDNSRTFTLQSELVVVKENLNWVVLLVGIITVTVICVVVDCCIIWCTLRYQKKKLRMSLAAERHSTQLRPRSLADLGCSYDEANHRRLTVMSTPPSEQRCLEQGLTLSYLRQTDLEAQQDHLSSKDSGTGSDAAVKRTLDDFEVAMPSHKHHTDDEEEEEEVEEVYEENEPPYIKHTYEVNYAEPEQHLFLQNNNHNYDGGGIGVAGGVNKMVPNALLRKCSAGASGSNYSSIQQCTTVDI